MTAPVSIVCWGKERSTAARRSRGTERGAAKQQRVKCQTDGNLIRAAQRAARPRGEEGSGAAHGGSAAGRERTEPSVRLTAAPRRPRGFGAGRPAALSGHRGAWGPTAARPAHPAPARPRRSEARGVPTTAPAANGRAPHLPPFPAEATPSRPGPSPEQGGLPPRHAAPPPPRSPSPWRRRPGARPRRRQQNTAPFPAGPARSLHSQPLWRRRSAPCCASSTWTGPSRRRGRRVAAAGLRVARGPPRRGGPCRGLALLACGGPGGSGRAGGCAHGCAELCAGLSRRAPAAPGKADALCAVSFWTVENHGGNGRVPAEVASEGEGGRCRGLRLREDQRAARRRR